MTSSFGLAVRLWKLALYAACGTILLFLILPTFVIIPLSFNSEPYFTFPIAEYSLRWYAAFFGSPEWRLALQNSVLIALSTALLATTLGTLAALGLTMADFPLKPIVLGLIVSPMMVPHIITGLGMFFLFAWLGLVNTFPGMVLAHTILAAPFVVLTVSATLSTFNRNLVRAAASLGANPVTTFFRVTLPMILPGVTGGAVLAFVVSFDEVVVAIFLAGSDQRTLPRQMWSGVREQISPTILAAATVLTTFAIVAMLLMEWLRRRGERLRGGRTGATLS